MAIDLDDYGWQDYGDYYYYDDDLSFRPMEEAIGDWFNVFDLNGDAAIDSNELNEAFTNLDADGDGFLSRIELLNGQISVTT